MLTARDSETNEKVVAARHKSGHELRLKHPLGSLICPFCNEIVFPRERKGFVLHFVHRNTCTCKYDHHPESSEHEQGKFLLAKYLQQQSQEYENKAVKIEVEYPLPECGQNGRIADVALVYENGNILICECQLSKITPYELEQRTKDYISIGADVMWFLGKEADTTENRAWIRSVFGSVGRIEFDYNSEEELLV